MADIQQYHLLKPDEIEQARNAFPVAFIPWGAIEWHSYHNPIGLDGLIADGLCRALAESTGGVVLPPIYVATDTIKEFKGFPHSIEYKASTVKMVCGELIQQLIAEGFEAVVIVTGHAGGGHTDALDQVAADINSQLDRAGVMVFTPFGPIQDQFPANHAADGETSLLLALHPNLVDLDKLPSDRETTLDDDGVWGEDPRQAEAARGEAIIEAFVAATSSKVLSLLNNK